jgi:hypothetical protein
MEYGKGQKVFNHQRTAVLLRVTAGKGMDPDK